MMLRRTNHLRHQLFISGILHVIICGGNKLERKTMDKRVVLYILSEMD